MLAHNPEEKVQRPEKRQMSIKSRKKERKVGKNKRERTFKKSASLKLVKKLFSFFSLLYIPLKNVGEERGRVKPESRKKENTHVTK